MTKRTMKQEQYIECPRCKLNNLDTPTFDGCPRGSCEVEVKGTLLHTTVLILDEPVEDD